MLTVLLMTVAIVALYCQIVWYAWHDGLEEVTWL